MIGNNFREPHQHLKRNGQEFLFYRGTVNTVVKALCVSFILMFWDGILYIMVYLIGFCLHTLPFFLIMEFEIGMFDYSCVN